MRIGFCDRQIGLQKGRAVEYLPNNVSGTYAFCGCTAGLMSRTGQITSNPFCSHRKRYSSFLLGNHARNDIIVYKSLDLYRKCSVEAQP
jgi:hypothetical protein